MKSDIWVISDRRNPLQKGITFDEFAKSEPEDNWSFSKAGRMLDLTCESSESGG